MLSFLAKVDKGQKIRDFQALTSSGKTQKLMAAVLPRKNYS